MSLLKRLFGGGAQKSGEPAVFGEPVQHDGFTIRATPSEGRQFQTSEVVSKEVGGVVKEHRFVRAGRVDKSVSSSTPIR